MTIHRIAATLLCALLALPAHASADLASIAADFHAVDRRLAAHIVDEAWLDADPQAPELLDRHWALAGQWVAAWLDAHPDADAQTVAAAFAAMGGDKALGQLQALPLTKGDWLLALPGPLGNVFIVAQRNGHHRVAWNIATMKLPATPAAEPLAAWRARNARQHGPGAEVSGPMDPQPGALPADDHDRARFWIDGTRAQAAGGTIGAQVSVWLWDGSTAHVLAVHPYAMAVVRDRGARVKDGVLKVREKGEFHAFSSCGACAGRETDWRMRVDGQSVDVLGVESAVPELDAVDAIVARRLHGKPAGDLATADAIAAVDTIIAGVRRDRDPADWRQNPTIGALGTYHVQVVANGIDVCLSTDDAGAHRFELRKDHSGLRLQRVLAVASGCGDGATP